MFRMIIIIMMMMLILIRLLSSLTRASVWLLTLALDYFYSSQRLDFVEVLFTFAKLDGCLKMTD